LVSSVMFFSFSSAIVMSTYGLHLEGRIVSADGRREGAAHCARRLATSGMGTGRVYCLRPERDGVWRKLTVKRLFCERPALFG